MLAFSQWQAEHAAERRARSAPADSAAAAEAEDAPPEVPVAEGAAAAAAATPGTGYALPPPPTWPPPVASAAELRDQVAELLSTSEESRRRAIAFAREVLRQLPSSALAQAAGVIGVAPIENGEAEPEAGATPRTNDGSGAAARVNNSRLPRQFQVDLRPPAGTQLPLAMLTWQEPCLCCDEVVGDGTTRQCAALQLLSMLEEEMAEHDAIIDREMDADGDGDYGSLHRAARKFIYRAFVGLKYGYLGKGNRVRIPVCVVAAIRARYRAPGCDCLPHALATCIQHGYMGHKEN